MRERERERKRERKRTREREKEKEREEGRKIRKVHDCIQDFQPTTQSAGRGLKSVQYTFKRLQSSVTSWGGKSITIASFFMVCKGLGRTYPTEVLPRPKKIPEIVTAPTWRTYLG